MVKRAFSSDLGKNISAEFAHRKSIIGELIDKRAFKCADRACQINLTCTNWKKRKDDIRIYFTPSSIDNLHIAGCNESGEIEERNRSKLEMDVVKKTIEKNGSIILKKITEQKTVKQEFQKIETKTPINNLSGIQNNKSTSKQSEGKYVTSILTLIELYNESGFDEKKRFLKISSTETLALNEFFFNVDKASNIPKDKIRIYYGKVKVSTYKETVLMIKFCSSSTLSPLFTNKNKILGKYYGKHAKNYVDTNKELYVFFRGHLNEDNKWCAYNNEFFKDLYFSINGL